MKVQAPRARTAAYLSTKYDRTDSCIAPYLISFICRYAFKSRSLVAPSVQCNFVVLLSISLDLVPSLSVLTLAQFRSPGKHRRGFGYVVTLDVTPNLFTTTTIVITIITLTIPVETNTHKSSRHISPRRLHRTTNHSNSRHRLVHH